MNFKNIVDRLPQGVYQSTREGRFLYANDALARILGYRDAVDLIASVENIASQHYVDGEFRSNLMRALDARGIATGIEYPLRRRCGGTIWIRLSAHVVRDAQGEVTCYEGVVEDVTERTSIRTALALKNNILRRSNEDLERFARILAHDINGPVSLAQTRLQLCLRSTALGPAERRWVEDAVADLVRANSITTHLLDSSCTNGSADEDVDLAVPIGNVLQAMASELRARDALVLVGPLPTVRGSSRLYERLFENLLGNAIKFRWAPRPLIRIHAREKASAWKIDVTDIGAGMDGADSSRIFGTGVRAHGDKFPGYGMGLAICHDIARRFGGSIEARGRLRVGSTFTVTLPKPRPSDP